MELGAKQRTLVQSWRISRAVFHEFEDNLIHDDVLSSIASWEVIGRTHHVLRECCNVLDTCCEYARSMRRVCYSFPQKTISTPCLGPGPGPAQSHILIPRKPISSSHLRYASKTRDPSTRTCCCASRMMLLCFCVMRAFCTLLGLNDIEVLAALSKVPESNGCERYCKCEHGPSKTALFIS